jgi:hypothetical protein
MPSAPSPSTLLRAAVALVPLAVVAAAPPARAVEPFVDFESGVAWAGYNDVRVPNPGGTRFSLTDDLETSAAPYFRVRAGATLGRHVLFAFFTPLRLDARGTLPADVSFGGVTFAAGAPVLARYRFDSPRVTWRYRLLRGERLEAEVGLTAKIREAAIVVQGGARAQTTDTGFVPLVAFRLAWSFSRDLALVLDGDAIAGLGPGRAEDVGAALEVRVRDGVRARIGYRIVEGGADVDQVYNFALVNHLGAGITVRL